MAQEERDERQAGGDAGSNGSPQGSGGLSKLLSKDVLIPAAATALTAAAAGLAAKKGPDLKNKVMGEAEENAQNLGRQGAEGAKQAMNESPLGKVAGGVSKLMPGGGKGGKKKTRRLPIQRWTDVAVPLEEAYEKWTSFEDFPKFMHRVLKVEQKDDQTIDWEEKIWFSKRQWQGEITDRRDNDRIAWKTVSGTSHSGVVSFHRLDDKLTRVLVTVDFQPAGLIEKMGSGLRFAKRAVQADLARFKAYAELSDAEGVDYEVAPGTDAKEEAQGDEREAESRQDGSSTDSSRNGSGSDEEREEERREREERRKERREAATSR